MNFARDVVDAMSPERRAIVEVAQDGRRREWTFGEVSDRSAHLAGALARNGVGQGHVVMTLIGNRPEWVLTMVACFRLGAGALVCNEQLRAKDLRIRLDAGGARPGRPVSDHVHQRHHRRAQGSDSRAAPPARSAPAGRALARRARRRPGVVHGLDRLVEVGAQLVHRPVAARRPRPTEYRLIAKRVDIEPVPACGRWWRPARRSTPRCWGAFRDGTGIAIRDGYGQTETGQLTANPVGEPVRPGSMGLGVGAAHPLGGGRGSTHDRARRMNPDDQRRISVLGLANTSSIDFALRP